LATSVSGVARGIGESASTSVGEAHNGADAVLLAGHLVRF
jgi:hypothetical protein